MTQPTFRQALDEGECFLFDGSTASALHDRGITLQRSFEECNLKAPDLLLAIHGEFLAAGSQVLTTNTWGANRLKLAARGLEGQLDAINREGVALAKQAIAQQQARAWVAGCIGPLGVRIEPWGPTSFEEARALFREQAEALVGAGSDLVVLEGFEDLNEIHQAILAVQEVGRLPLAALMTTNDEGQALFGAEPEWFIKQLDTWGADLVGLIGGNGPAPHLRLLEHLKGVTTRPIVLLPNPGLPHMVDGRLIYGASPEYLGGFAARALAGGARAVGGCSGTTAAHIRAMRGAFRQERAFVQAGGRYQLKPHEQPQPEVPFAFRSRFSLKLAQGEFTHTVELVPPKGMEYDKLLAKTRQCRALGVDAINVPDGPRAMARMSALATALIIEQQVGVETILHYACRDRNLLGMQSDLLGAAGLGLRNILAVTGDPPKLGPYPQATAVFDVDAIGLVNMLKRLNTGLDLGGASIGKPTSFSVGVGANPVAPDPERERARFRYKVEAGAQWAITQPVFDPDSLFRFLDFAEGVAPGLPVIAGIWPFKSLRNAEFMANEVPGVLVPPALLTRMARWATTEDQVKEGLAIAQETIEAIRPRIRGLQLSAPFGQVELVAPLLPKRED
ncbi:bifunctional homocysteine S-methyltransferase/methylenetetrahydrofolate reductase [Geothrix alkalitolerans]|uniref:bifunctional homocysteine S-methyltransferase/methylenetetrahydrofolate reductase n=1 Tax=Geothrix alkalitolerans TaxID=2922724 RepID=UPI001FAFADB7|nr:bifunctional homocysteine S-methyltransferase/methylenetetrahydrofolate reductase [Geothrix alkalitolerans]